MDKICCNCANHETFTDEIDGEYYDDGCLCHHVLGDKEFHINCCYEYTSSENFKECIYFEESQ
jgi:hypothetical protein